MKDEITILQQENSRLLRERDLAKFEIMVLKKERDSLAIKLQEELTEVMKLRRMIQAYEEA